MSDSTIETSDPSNVEIRINIGLATITVRSPLGNNTFDTLFCRVIEAVERNKEKIYALGSLEESQKDESPKLQTKMEHENLFENIIESVGDKIKFTAERAFELAPKEAIALLLYYANKPLSPKDIDNYLTSGWKKVVNVSRYLGRELKQVAVKVSDGYILTGAGKRWVENEIIPKLKGPTGP